MDVPEQHAQWLAALASAIPCDKNHECLKSNPGTLCKAELAAGGKVLLCLEEDPWRCRHYVRFGRGAFCMCAIRQYIARHLGM
jgi:hypothetical protein